MSLKQELINRFEEEGKTVEVMADPLHPEKKYVCAEFVNYAFGIFEEVKVELKKCKALLEWDEVAEKILKKEDIPDDDTEVDNILS